MSVTVLDSRQLCRELQISPTTLMRLRAENVIRSFRIRTRIRFVLEEVIEDLRRSGNESGLRRIQGKFVKSGGPRAGRGHTATYKGRVKANATTVASDSIEEALGLPAHEES